MGPRHVAITLALALSLGTLATTRARDARSVSTSCTVVVASEVCTWVVMQGERPLELGATVPLAIIEGVPLDVEMVWPPEPLAVVALPTEARSALGIDHMGINWEAHGHPPAAFLTRHFDFHFYNITRDRVDGIDCTDESKPSQLPSGYVLPDIDVPGMGTLVGLCVPRMGMHAMPEMDAVGTGAFEASMILGYYGGEPTFFEPMISQEVLLQKSDFTLRVPAVAHLPAGVRYPTSFRAEYDDALSAYRLIFSGF
jgi:hypothetical protein